MKRPFSFAASRRVPPKPRLGHVHADRTWAGILERAPDGIVGSLSDRHGWRLSITGLDGPDQGLALRAAVSRAGSELAPWDDQGLRVALVDRPDMPLAGLMVREGSGWTGVISFPDGERIDLSGAPDGPGRIVLQGVG